MFKNMAISKTLQRTIKTKKTLIPLNNLCKLRILILIMIYCPKPEI